ncbi:MAG: flagellar basal body rod protein FlgB [Woeseiaceae bacterium]|nr:flagellar basal body rod protein FlgB [Woeseiaceae bacterium]
MKIDSLALHEASLKFRAHRNEVLSSNIANADTPNYKARDLDFATALAKVRGTGVGLLQTSALHLGGPGSARSDGDLKYRIPTQPTLDGNTVETDVEQAAFAENALQYRASLSFVDSALKSLRFAIKGSD